MRPRRQPFQPFPQVVAIELRIESGLQGALLRGMFAAEAEQRMLVLLRLCKAWQQQRTGGEKRKMTKAHKNLRRGCMSRLYRLHYTRSDQIAACQSRFGLKPKCGRSG